MSDFDHYLTDAELQPPQRCRAHHVPESVLAACFHSGNGRAPFSIQVCPRCWFTDEHDIIAGVWRAWDGTAWVAEGSDRILARDWLAQTRAEGLASDSRVPSYKPDVAGVPSIWGLHVWAFTVLHPDVPRDEVVVLIASTSIARRRGASLGDIPWPYTPLENLRASSAQVVEGWESYHEALVAELSDDDVAMATVTGFDELFAHGEDRHDGRGPEDGHFPRDYRPPYDSYAARLREADDRVQALGIRTPSREVRFACHGDTFGSRSFDIALGLHDWLHGRLAWRRLLDAPST